MRPFVLLNMAMTADGKIATANHAVASFGSPRDASNLLQLRTRADAVLCGARTAGSPGVTLGPGGLRYQRIRRRQNLAEFNLRVVVSGSARLNPKADVFSESRSPLIVLTTQDAPATRLRRLEAAGAILGRFGKARVDLPSALTWLASEWKVRNLVCEGGAELNDAMFRADLIDEVHVTVCPLIFGGRSAPTLMEGLGFPGLPAAASLKLQAMRRRGDELFLTYRVVHPPPSSTPA